MKSPFPLKTTTLSSREAFTTKMTRTLMVSIVDLSLLFVVICDDAVYSMHLYTMYLHTHHVVVYEFHKVFLSFNIRV